MSQPDLSSQLVAAQARIAELEQALAVLEVVKPDLAAEIANMDHRLAYLMSVIADRDARISSAESARDRAYQEGKRAGWDAGRERGREEMRGPPPNATYSLRDSQRIHRTDVRTDADMERYKRQEIEEARRRYEAERAPEPIYAIRRKQFEKFGY